MKNRFFALVTALTLCLLLLPAHAEEAPQPLTGAEVKACIEGLKAQALAAQPLNDPAAEDSESEDGYAFVYEFATLYADQPQMTEDTAVLSAVVTGGDTALLRGIKLDQTSAELLAAYPCDNPQLDGSREEALLYLQGDTEQGYRFGLVLRDGQRLQVVEYGEAAPAENGWATSYVIYTIQSDLVASVHVGSPSGGGSAEEAKARFEELAAMSRETGYTRAPSSLNGLELTPFSEEDLTFGGISYLQLQPDSFGGSPEDVIMADGDGYLRVVEGEGYSAVFTCDYDGGNAVIRSYSILSEDLEGPRGVRLGDTFHEDFTRFRSGENETDGVTELLYGTEGTAPWGWADYAAADGGMELRYVTALSSGGQAELLLRYHNNLLSEIILHTIE